MYGAVLLVLALQGDPAKDLRSKDPLERLAAVDVLAAGEHSKREKLLIDALQDEDWEVVERAARALGAVGGGGAAEALADLCLAGPTARVRRVAAEALARVDAAEGFDAVAKRVASDQAGAACLAMCALAPELDGKVSLKPAEKALKSKEPEHRAAAARALVRLAGEERPRRLAELLEHDEVRARCAAVEAAGAAGDPSLAVAALLIGALGDDAEVVERRVAVALTQLLAAAEGDELVRAVCAAPATVPAAARARAVRMLGRVAALEGSAVPDADAVQALVALYPEADVPVRAAIGDALGRIGSDAAIARATAITRDDESARVRRAALRAVTRRRPAADGAEALDLALRLAGDPDAGVREDAAVALGVKDAAAAVDPLVRLLRDPAWEVAVVAAVSLGKTRAAVAVEPLADLARDDADWRLRGAAVVGLGHLNLKEAVPHVIAALGDGDAPVRRTALEYLVALAGRRIEPEVKAWSAWWDDVEKRIVLVDADEEQARRVRYGYERSAREIYAGLDVLVFESRGDHIQNVLAGLGIEHRLTAQGRVAEDAPHARAVFFSNCTGEMTGADVARLAWFVRVGGYLAGSCWALQETIARAVPGVVARLETRGEVLDDVPAAPCAPDSPYLAGVFAPDVTPIYALQGAYLIQVLDPERCEVLVDSPACHDRWGGGNLAVWFPAGHGVVLASANHFEEQGLARATWLKKPEERQAYAVDHLGLGYGELRATRDAKWWKRTTDSAQEVKDLSVFRLISNFVRQKRIAGDG